VKFRVAASFQKDYKRLPEKIRRKVDKQLVFLGNNPRHPSLNMKKMVGTDLFEVRVDPACRLTLRIKREMVELRRVGTHDILKREGEI